MDSFVIDPDQDNRCYGKYERSASRIPEHWEDVVRVADLDKYEVVEWRYEE